MSLAPTSSATFHRLTQEFAALAPTDDIVVQEGQVAVQHSSVIYHYLKRFLAIIGRPASIADAVSQLFINYKREIGVDDLAGLVGAANYLARLSTTDERVQDCLKVLVTIQREVHPLFKLPKSVLLKIVAHSGPSWSKSFQVMRLVCTSTKGQLPLHYYFQQSKGISKMLTPWFYGRHLIDGVLDKAKYGELIENQLSAGNLDIAAFLFMAFHNRSETTAVDIGSLLPSSSDADNIRKWIKLLQKVGPELIKFALQWNSDTLDAVLPHLQNIKSLSVTCEAFGSTPGEFSRVMEHCLNIEELFISSASGFDPKNEPVFAKLTKLRQLCYLSNVPKERLSSIARLPLATLERLSIVAANSRLPQLAAYKKLQTLQLINFRLTRADVKAIKKLPPVNFLSLMDVHAPQLLLALQLQASLRQLHVEVKSAATTTDVVVATLRRHTGLKMVTIWTNSRWSVKDLSAVLTHCRTLEKIEVPIFISTHSELEAFSELLRFNPLLATIRTVHIQGEKLHCLFAQMCEKLPHLAHQKFSSIVSLLE